MSALMRNFEFEGQGVRTVELDGLPWFALVDVCAVLDIGNSRQAAARLDDDEKKVHSADTHGGNQKLTLINESGLYSLIFTSRKEEARRFKKWVTDEVLPSLRKYGHYEMPDAGEVLDDDLPASADNKLFGVKLTKVGTLARMMATVSANFGPEAARFLYSQVPEMPNLQNFTAGKIAGSVADDQIGCLKHLMRVAVGNGLSVGQRVKSAMSDIAIARELATMGINLSPPKAPGYVAIAERNRFLSVAFGETQWIGDWTAALRKLPRAKLSSGPMQFGDTQSRAVLVPLDVVLAAIPAN